MKLKKGLIFAGVFILLPAILYVYRFDISDHFSYWQTQLEVKQMDFSQKYVDEDLGITFNYPSTGEVYRWDKNKSNQLRIFSKKTVNGSQVGLTCDLYINTQRSTYGEPDGEVTYNNLIWTKTRTLEHSGLLGDFFDAHFESWHTNTSGQDIVFTSTIELEPYCERIISTFSIYK